MPRSHTFDSSSRGTWMPELILELGMRLPARESVISIMDDTRPEVAFQKAPAAAVRRARSPLPAASPR